jgi:hypothetical protein
MMYITVDQFLSRLIGDGDFREAFYSNPLKTCAQDESGLTWSEVAALLSIAEVMLAEFARGVPNVADDVCWKEDTTNRVALRSH